jgi:pimeloyl-ACP methyl ester carboxylesterase
MRLAWLFVALWAATANAKPRWQELPLPPAMPEAAEHGTVEVGGVHIYYARYGKSDGDPVILLHGGLGNSDHWSNQVLALDDKFKVFVIDSRGQGRSTRTKAPVTYDIMAADVLAVMDHLKLERASLVGWSDGGEIAMKIAIAHPERVAKLFIFGVNYDSNGSKPRGGPPAATFSGYASKCRADYAKMSATPKAWDSLVDWLLPIWRNPMGFTKDQLRGIQVPTMVADGDHDEVIVLSQVEEMAKLIPHAQLKIFTDASHFALWQDPKAFDDVLVEFLSVPATP